MTISITPISPLAGQGFHAVGKTEAGSRHDFAEVLGELPSADMTGDTEASVEPLSVAAALAEKVQEPGTADEESADKAEGDAPAVGVFPRPTAPAEPEQTPNMPVWAPAPLAAVSLTEGEPVLRREGARRQTPEEVSANGSHMSADWLVQIEHGKRWQQAATEDGGNKLPPSAVSPQPASDQEPADAAESTENERRVTAGGKEPAVPAGGSQVAEPAASELRTLMADMAPAVSAGGDPVTESAAHELQARIAGKEPALSAGGDPVTESAVNELQVRIAGKEPALSAGGDPEAKLAVNELQVRIAGKAPALSAGGDPVTESAVNELQARIAGKAPALSAGGDPVTESAASELRTLIAGEEPAVPADEEPATASATDDLRALAVGKESAVLASADIATAQDTLPGGSLFQRDGQLQVTAERSIQPERALTLQGAPEQGARQLAQQVQVMVNQNLQEADIRLSPSDLGGLRIQLRIEQGEVHVQFLASQPQARELLEQALPRLREMLVQQGLNLGQGLVGGFGGQQGSQQQGAQQQSASASPFPRSASDGVNDGAEPAATDWKPVHAPWQDINGRIDFFA